MIATQNNSKSLTIKKASEGEFEAYIALFF